MSNFFKKWAPSLVGAAVGGITSSMPNASKYSAALSAGAGALTGAATKQNIGTSALQGFGGGLAGSMGTQAVKGAINNTGFGAGSGEGWRSYLQSIPGMGGFGTSNPTGALAKFTTMKTPSVGSTGMTTTAGGFSKAPMANNAYTPSAGNNSMMQIKAGMYGNDSPLVPDSTTSFKMNPYSNMTPTSSVFGNSPLGNQGVGTTPIAKPAAVQKQGIMDNFFGKSNNASTGTAGSNTPTWKTTAAGIALPLLGQMTSPKAETSDYSGIIAQQQALQATGGDPVARELGLNEMKSVLTAANAGMATNALAQVSQSYDDAMAAELRNYDQQWKAAAPGADFSNNSEYLAGRQRLIQELTMRKANALGAAQQTIDTQVAANKLDAMKVAFQNDNQRIQEAMALANLSVQQIQEKTGADAQTAMEWKEAFGAVGSALLNSGVQAPQTFQLKVV